MAERNIEKLSAEVVLERTQHDTLRDDWTKIKSKFEHRNILNKDH